MILWKKYVGYILIPLVLTFLLVFYLTSLLRQQVLQQNALTIDQAVEILDNRLEYTGLLSLKVMNDPEVIALCRAENNGNSSFFYTLRAGWKTFQGYDSMLEELSMVLYCERSAACLSTSKLCTDAKRFYGSLFQFGDMDLNEFLHYLQSATARRNYAPVTCIRFDRQTSDGLIYQYRFQTLGTSSFLFFVLDRDYLERLFMVPAQNGTVVYLMDPEGTPLFSTGEEALAEEFFVDGKPDLGALSKRNIVSFSTAAAGLQVLCITPHETATQGIGGIEILLRLFFILASLLAVLLSFLMAKRNAPALEYIFRNRPDMDDISWKDIYKGMREVLLRYQRDNARLLDSVREGQFRLKREFFIKLLRNEFQHTHDLEIYARDALIDLGGFACYYLILALDDPSPYPGPEELNRLQNALEELRLTLESRSLTDSFVIPLELGRLALILKSGRVHVGGALIDALSKDLSRFCEQKGLLFAGCKTDSPIEIYMLPLVSAQCTMNLNWKTGREGFSGGFFTIDLDGRMLPRADQSPSAPKESGLFTAIRAGDAKAALDNFDALFFMAVARESVTGAARAQFLGQMKNILSLARTGAGGDPPDTADLMCAASLSPTLYRHLAGQIRALCECHAQRRRDNAPLDAAAEFRNNVSLLIDGGIAEPSLSLTTAARKFGFAPSYFSMLFKEYMGVNFLAYVERRRMDLARRRLTTVNETVEETAAACGYQSTNTFRRIYKKTFGVTPSQTREAQKPHAGAGCADVTERGGGKSAL